MAGVPAAASAAVVKVTVTETAGAGFITAFPAETAKPLASNVNFDNAGATISNEVIAAVTGGRLAIYSSTATHVIVDIKGYFTGTQAANAKDGLFVPLAPVRLLDTRDGGHVVPAGSTTSVAVAGRGGMPASNVSAVVVNATLTGASAPGFVTVWPANTPQPNTSSLNARFAGDTFAGHSLTPVSTDGFSMYSLASQHMLADITGYYTGAPVAATVAPTAVGFNYLQTYKSQIIRWNPCTDLRYAINTNGFGNEQMIHDAMAAAAAIAGINVRFVGHSTHIATKANPLPPEVANAGRRLGPYDILISLGTPEISDMIGGATVGLATNFSAMGSGFSLQFTKSSVMVDMRSAANGIDAVGGTTTVLRHELAHALGLGHFESHHETMNPAIGHFSPTSFNVGDTAGLRAVGVNAGCLIDNSRTQSDIADDFVQQVELD